MDGPTARKAGRRSRALRATTTPEARRRELVALLGDGLARLLEQSPRTGEELSESDATRVELPSDAGLSVAAGDGCPPDGGS
ncbi:MAG: hypothetical protein AAF235_01680 [Planctomycetota bacterium]